MSGQHASRLVSLTMPPRLRDRQAAPSRSEPAPGWAALNGVLALGFGLAAALFPGPTALAIVVVLAACALATGLIQLVAVLSAGQGWRQLRVASAYIALAFAALHWPVEAIGAVVLWIALSQLVAATRALACACGSNVPGRPGLIADGVLRAVLGGLLLVHPVAGVVAMTLWVGIAAVSYGLHVTLDSGCRLAVP